MARHGEEHHATQLTNAQVQKIRAEYDDWQERQAHADKVSPGAIREKYGLSRSQFWDIVSFRTWKDVG